MDLRSRLLRRRLGASLAVALTLGIVAVAAPSSAAEPAGSEQIRKAIGERGAAYMAAVAKGDLAAVLAFWMPDAVIVDAFGNTHKAHDYLKDRVAARKEGAAVKEVADRGTIRVVTPEVAIEEGTLSDPESTAEGVLQYNVVWVLSDKQWKIDSARETLVPKASSYGSLHELAWMVGEWRGQQGDNTIDLKIEYVGEGALLRRDFAITDKNQKKIHSGTQIIAWDPDQHKIRSWSFDSAGTVSEGVWHHDGVIWTVTSHGFMADGSLTRSIDDYELTEKGMARYSSDVWVGEHQVPDSEIVLAPVPAAK